MFAPGRRVAPRLGLVDLFVQDRLRKIYLLVLDLEKIYFVLFAVRPHCLVEPLPEAVV